MLMESHNPFMFQSPPSSDFLGDQIHSDPLSSCATNSTERKSASCCGARSSNFTSTARVSAGFTLKNAGFLATEK
jgi:hypothetical protein